MHINRGVVFGKYAKKIWRVMFQRCEHASGATGSRRDGAMVPKEKNARGSARTRSYWAANLKKARHAERQRQRNTATTSEKLDDEAGSKIGSELHDSTAHKTYPYAELQPFYRDLRQFLVPKRHVPGRMRPLKLLAAKMLARNSDLLSSVHLGVGSWEVWREVWELILLNEMDSPRVFALFAKQFGDSRGFRAHLHVLTRLRTSNGARCKALAERVLNFHKHRLETLGWNSLHLPHCLQHHGFQNIVILDISALSKTPVRHSSDFYLSLTGIRSLALLDCSSLSDVNDTVCKSWAISLKMGKWPSLRAICLNQTSVSFKSVHELLCLPNLQLYYAETSFKLSLPEGWESVQISGHIMENTSLKFWYLEKNRRPQFIDEASAIVMDYKITQNALDIDLGQTDRTNYQLEQLWSNRAVKSRTDHGYSYVLTTPIRDNGNVRHRHPTTDPAKSKKPKLQKADHKSFFGL